MSAASSDDGTGRTGRPSSGAEDQGTPDRTVRVRLDLRYDGTDFAGWASQPGLRTVQQTLETALTTVLRLPAPARLTVAGRTDAGVHARGQVAHVDLPLAAWQAASGRSDRPPAEALVSRLSGVLASGMRPRGGSDVVVRRARLAPAGFDARFSAVWRRYAYRVTDALTARDPLRRHDVLWHGRPLDVTAMAAAAQRLLGEHDFAAYCKPREGATTIRTLQELRWERIPDGAADDGLVLATVRADAFCHSMVRALVGACLTVGEGRRPADWPAAVLAARLRDPAVAVVPAHGLTLEEVGYPRDDDLAARATRARSRRALPG